MQFSFRPRGARQLALAAGALSLASFLASCNKGGGDFDKTKSGIEYKIFKNVGGKYERRDVKGDDPTYKDRVGKFMTAYLYYRTGKDSVLEDTRKKFAGSAVPMPLMEVKRKGAPDEAFALLQPGDSAVFRFNADSLFKPQGRPVPGFLKKSGNVIVINVKTDKLISREEEQAMEQTLQQKMMAEQQKQMQAYAATQNKKDEVVIQDYLKKNNLAAQAKKTPGGVYYIVTQAGAGAQPKPGQTVSVQYRGTLLDGKEFDSSAKSSQGKPFTYPLGRGQVIPGWDEGMAMLSKGAKATLLIPSSLAYGERGSLPAIPANSPLRFDVELVDIQNAPAQQMQQPQMPQ
ncbi:MAG: FKBP-type peptidyl-prolyl cis-trans isomerase [Janthinobacterium lividum]